MTWIPTEVCECGKIKRALFVIFVLFILPFSFFFRNALFSHFCPPVVFSDVSLAYFFPTSAFFPALFRNFKRFFAVLFFRSKRRAVFFLKFRIVRTRFALLRLFRSRNLLLNRKFQIARAFFSRICKNCNRR